MLRARTSDGLFILGLDAENIRRLKNGEPIVVSLAQMGGKDDVMIMYGETLEAIKSELESTTGQPMPEEQKMVTQ